MTALRWRWPGLAAGYVGAVVGAGFASGREIMHFFVPYGVWGLWGAMLAGVLFGAAGAIILKSATLGNHKHYGSLLRELCGHRLGTVLDHVSTAFLFVGVVAVTAGAGALGRLVLHWPQCWSVLAFAGGLSGTLLGGRTLHVVVNIMVVPVMVFICLLAAVAGLSSGMHAFRASPPPTPWPLASLLYVAYNLLLAIAGLCAAADGKQTVDDAFRAGWVGGIVLGLLCMAATAAMLTNRGLAELAELPLAGTIPPGFLRSMGYPLVLFAALWTTGSASGLALGARLSPRFPRRWAILMVVAAAPFAAIGLSPIITVAYPIMGYAGVLRWSPVSRHLNEVL